MKKNIGSDKELKYNHPSVNSQNFEGHLKLSCKGTDSICLSVQTKVLVSRQAEADRHEHTHAQKGRKALQTRQDKTGKRVELPREILFVVI